MAPVTPVGRPEWPFKLGKKPAVPGAVKMHATNYFTLARTKAPEHFRSKVAPKWGEYGNRDYGNCVLVGAANETALWEMEGGLPEPQFTTATVLAEYAEVAGFDPNAKKDAAGNNPTDEGTGMPDAARHRRTKGIMDARGFRHTIDGYAALRLHNMEYLKSALWVLGGVGLGFIFPNYAMKQFNAKKPWDVPRKLAAGGGWWEWLSGANDEGSDDEGGHYVPAIGIAPNGNIITVSWGREQEMTPSFYMKYADEVICYIDLDRLAKASKLSPQGFNEARLRADLAAVARGKVYALNDAPTDWA